MLVGLVAVIFLFSLSPVTSLPPSDGRIGEARGMSQCDIQTVTLAVGDTAVFTSPNYPQNYGMFTTCSRNFEGPESSKLTVACNPVTLSMFASLTVTVNGNSQPLTSGTTLTFSSNKATISFSNNFMFTARGFSCSVTATDNSLGTCKCGRQLNSRIVGGDVVTMRGKYPWMVALTLRNDIAPFCGGSLISSEYILTAAHCLEDQSLNDLDVRMGLLDYTSSNEGIRKQVKQIISHPDYNTNTEDNDFALLKIDKIDFTNADYNLIRPICLPESTTNLYDGEKTTTTGWGRTQINEPISPVLREVDVTVMTNAACTASYANDNTITITDNMVCAADAGKDSCKGDSGGPLKYNSVSGTEGETPIYDVIGVVSFGDGCAQPDLPGVYSRVTAQRAWILANTDSDGFCPRN